jgi:large subunit ribosomal protein L30
MLELWLRTEASAWKKYLEDRRNNNMAILKIKQIKSRIGAPKDQKSTLDTLGLRKMNQIVEREDTPSVLGMVEKVKHLVTIVK